MAVLIRLLEVNRRKKVNKEALLLVFLRLVVLAHSLLLNKEGHNRTQVTFRLESYSHFMSLFYANFYHKTK